MWYYGRRVNKVSLATEPCDVFLVLQLVFVALALEGISSDEDEPIVEILWDYVPSDKFKRMR